MAEVENAPIVYQEESAEVYNPYLVGAAPSVGISMVDQQQHDSGNALAANAEARVIAEVKAQVLMSRQFPRNPAVSMTNILRECARPTLADAAVYVFPRGKESVTGPSIRLAEVMARNWGNCTYGLEVLERKKGSDGVGYSVVRAYAWDLETNTYIARQFELKHWRQTKSGGYGLKEDRDIYELEANMGSRRMRACILQMIPGDVTAAAVNECRRVASSGLNAMMADPKQRAVLVAKMQNIFGKLGASTADIEEYLGCKVTDWNADHMLKLKELKNSIEDGAVSIGEIFPRLAAAEHNDVISKDQVSELMKLAKATGMQQTISNELKKMGIAKFADIPTGRFEEIKYMISSLGEAVKNGAIAADEKQNKAIESAK